MIEVPALRSPKVRGKKRNNCYQDVFSAYLLKANKIQTFGAWLSCALSLESRYVVEEGKGLRIYNQDTKNQLTRTRGKSRMKSEQMSQAGCAEPPLPTTVPERTKTDFHTPEFGTGNSSDQNLAYHIEQIGTQRLKDDDGTDVKQLCRRLFQQGQSRSPMVPEIR